MKVGMIVVVHLGPTDSPPMEERVQGPGPKKQDEAQVLRSKGALGGAGISTMGKSMSGGGKASTEVQQMEVMTLLVESMKALQRQISEGHEAQGTIKGVEVVRQLAELPTLGSLQGNTSQLQLGDWLLLVSRSWLI